MKLYLLTRMENCPNSGLDGYDQYDAFVLCAETPGKAREMAYRHSGTNSSSEKFDEWRAESVWKDPQATKCMVIGRPSGPITEPQVILSDFHAG